MSIRVGNTPSSWGIWFADDPLQLPWQRFLDEVARAQFEWVELGPYGYLPADSTVLKNELAGRHLKLTAGFVAGNLSGAEGIAPVLEKVERVGALLSELNARYLIVFHETYLDLHTGKPNAAAELTDDAWKRLIENIHSIADRIGEKFGLSLLYEPHTATYVEKPEQIERLLQDTDPLRVNLCFDIGHFGWRGSDPVPFYRKHAGRIPYLHLKNLDPVIQRRVRDEQIPFPQAVGMGMFSEPSAGTLDFEALLAALREKQFDGWTMVEQGMYPAPFDKPFPIALRTREYMRETGWA